MNTLTTSFVKRLRDRDETAWFELWQVFGPVLRAQLSKWGKGRGLYEWHAGTYARTAQMRNARQMLKVKADELQGFGFPVKPFSKKLNDHP